jgi:hypothetical protein
MVPVAQHQQEHHRQLGKMQSDGSVAIVGGVRD